MIIAEQFGRLLRRYRQRAGMTLRELGAAVHLDYTYISKVENMVIPPPSAHALIRMAVALRLSEDEEAEFYAVAELTKAPNRVTNAALLRNPGLRPLFEVAATRRLTDDQMRTILAAVEDAQP